MCQSNPVHDQHGVNPLQREQLSSLYPRRAVQSCPDVIKPIDRLPILGAPVSKESKAIAMDNVGLWELPAFVSTLRSLICWNMFHMNLMIRFGLCNLHTLEWDCWILSSQLSHAHQRIVCAIIWALHIGCGASPRSQSCLFTATLT